VTGPRYSLPSVNWLRFPGGDGVDALTAPRWPLAELLAAAAAAGFDAVGLDDLTLRAHLDAGGKLEDVPQLLRGHGLALSDVGVLRIGEGDALEVAELLARLAALTGAPTCLTGLYVPLSDTALEQLRACAHVLRAAGARLALEHAAYGQLRTLADSVSLCEAVGWDEAGVLVDSWHFFRGERPWELLRSLDAGEIALVHVNDGPAERADPMYESRFERLPPGAGTFPLDAFAAAVAATGYDGPISAEVLSAELRALPPSESARILFDALGALRFPSRPRRASRGTPPRPRPRRSS
jgi:sugar phosphate isomerase/epimerase